MGSGEVSRVPIDALRRTVSDWTAQAEGLRSARAVLLDVEDGVGGLGHRVGSAARAFVSAWIDALSGRRSDALAHAETVEVSADAYAEVDAEQEAALLALLPVGDWSLRPGPS